VTSHESAGASSGRPLSDNILDAKAKLLVLDDDQLILDVLKRMLEILGYEVMVVSDAQSALDIVRSGPDKIDVILSDINMPGMNGIQFIQCVKDIDPNIVTVIITGFASSENAIASLRAGAFNLISKPFNNNELSIVIERAVEKRRLKRQLDSYHSHIEELLRDKTKELQKSIDTIKDSYVKTMETIVSMLDAHESSTALHSRRVSELAVIVAKRMEITDKGELDAIMYGALLHDIGKIGIPDYIINKPSGLTEEEKKLMRTHVELGYNIVKNIPILSDAAEIVFAHHERFDGTGYPRGLKGKEICIGARIFSLVDAFDALRSGRSYKSAQSIENIIKEINSCSGSQFDPDVIKVFNNCCNEMSSIYTSGG